MKSLGYYSVYIFIFLLYISYHIGGNATFIIPFVTFFIIPILEIILGEYENDNEEYDNNILNIIEYYIPLWLWVFVQIYSLNYFCADIYKFSFFEFLFFSISVGIVNGGIGINVAHDLIHKTNKIEKLLGKILLCSVCYGHFYIEHIWGHHRNVGTIMDSSTAKIDESIYNFIPRSIIDSYKNARNLGLNKNINPIIIYNCITLSYLILILFFYGLYACLFIIIQSFFAILILESVNYIEHYGLVRKEDYISIYDSWNTNNKVTNYLTFKLQAHSDHHMNSSKRYYYNIMNVETPTLSTGYIGSIMMAYIPKLWFSVMNPKIINFNKRNQ